MKQCYHAECATFLSICLFFQLLLVNIQHSSLYHCFTCWSVRDLLVSDRSDWDGVRANWIWERVGSTTRGHVGDGACGKGELVESAHQIPLEGVGLLVSNPALMVLVVVIPSLLEVGVEESRHILWLQLVSSLKNGSSSDLSLILHEQLLSGLVARGS